METLSDGPLVIENFNEDNFQFIHPFRFLIAGPSNSGKSRFVTDFILNKDKIINTGSTIKKILYIYGCEQDEYKRLEGRVIFTKDIKAINEKFNEPTLIVLDDMQEEIKKNVDDVKKLIIMRSHHESISVIIVMQNLFANSAFTKTIRLNISNYYILKHCFAFDQLEHLGRQLEGFRKAKLFLEAYEIAVEKPFQGLIIDLHPLSTTKDIFRYRYFENGDILRPVFLVEKEKANIIY